MKSGKGSKRPRIRKPGSLDDVKKVLWQSIVIAKECLLNSHDDDVAALKAAHCISQCSGQYAKLLELSDLEERMVTIEEAIKSNQNLKQNFGYRGVSA